MHKYASNVVVASIDFALLEQREHALQLISGLEPG